jgi:hypothetical protein
MKRAEKKIINQKKHAELQAKARKKLKEEKKPDKIDAKVWSPEFIESILDQVAEGKYLKHICEENRVAFRWFYKKIYEDEELTKQYEEAKRISAALDFDRLDEIAEERPREIVDAQNNKVFDRSDIEWKKVRMDCIKYRLPRKDKRYSDRIEMAGDKENPLGFAKIDVPERESREEWLLKQTK